MKLPKFIAVCNFTLPLNYFQRYYENNIGLLLKAENWKMKVEGNSIFACTRPTYYRSENAIFTKHCFLKYVNRESGETLDSVSFSPNEAAGARDAKTDSSKAVCSSVKSGASEADWQAVKNYYAQNCRPENWRENYNCCTCASEGMANALQVEPPPHILHARYGLRI